MENKMENEMETGGIQGFMPFIYLLKYPFRKVIWSQVDLHIFVYVYVCKYMHAR